MPRKTAWFDGEMVPCRPGVYECDWGSLGDPYVDDWPWFNEWTGVTWRWGSDTPSRAKRNGHGPSRARPVRWRGVARPNGALTGLPKASPG